MKIYCVEINDYDLHDDIAYYKDKKKAIAHMKRLQSKNSDYLWKEHLEVREKELIE